jgi:hypothetical protein
MSVDPVALNGFGYAAWSFSPAYVFYLRNEPGAAQIAINNMGSGAMNWLQASGATDPLKAIHNIHDAGSCDAASNVLKSWLVNFLRNYGTAVQSQLYDLGSQIGGARTHIMHDGVSDSQWPVERDRVISLLQTAQHNLPACLGSFNQPLIDLAFEVNSCAPFANATQDKLIKMLSDMPSYYAEHGP